jgi:hypothetical protein
MLADDEYLHGFHFYDPVRGISLGGRVRIFTLELAKTEAVAHAKTAKEMASAERWAAYFLYNADESEFARKLIKDIMKEEEGVKMATEVLSLFSEDEKRFYRLLSEQKYEMDHYTRMMEAEERGEERERRKSEAIIADKDAALADKNAALADKDATIADKDAEIARLRALIDGGR